MSIVHWLILLIPVLLLALVVWLVVRGRKPAALIGEARVTRGAADAPAEDPRP